jgi:hypothetical protein
LSNNRFALSKADGSAPLPIEGYFAHRWVLVFLRQFAVCRELFLLTAKESYDKDIVVIPNSDVGVRASTQLNSKRVIMKSVNFCASLIALAAAASCGIQGQTVSSKISDDAMELTRSAAVISVSGEDAKMLFSVMEVKSSEFSRTQQDNRMSEVKKGVNITCEKMSDLDTQSAAAQYTCGLVISDRKAGFVTVADASPIWNTPEIVLENTYEGRDVTLIAPYTAHHGFVTVLGRQAKTLFETLDVTPGTAPGEGTIKESIRKQGGEYECLRNTWATGQGSYNCVFYVDYNRGSLRAPKGSF